VTGLAVAVIATALLVFVRQRGTAPPSHSASRAGLDSRQLALARAIADLDERFERGEVDAEEYRLVRERTKGELVNSMMRSGR
jgi:uncharacterized membrane protein